MNRSTTAFALTLTAAFVLVATKPAEGYTSGTSYFGRAKYVEYMAGDLPVILSAPHGGYLTPSEIPDRTAARCGGSTNFVTGGDYMTKELAFAIRWALFNATGRWPHVIINHLARAKLDANRDELAAACSDPEAQTAWREYHGFIDVAKMDVVAQYGTGFLADVHGHAHTIQRIEIGTLTTADELRLADATLDAKATYEDLNSMRYQSQLSVWTFSELLRGPASLGSRLAALGYRSIPSVNDPYPKVGEAFFDGGGQAYTVKRLRASSPAASVQRVSNIIGLGCVIRQRTGRTIRSSSQSPCDSFFRITPALRSDK